jgi:SAM-dependent methyltransferase
MKAETAVRLSDAIARTRHPRLDFRTEEARRYTRRLHPFLEKVIFPGCRALDLGCAAGKFAFEMEALGAEAVGLDCSPEAIALAKEIAAQTGSRAVFHVGTFDQIPFPAASFDLVLFPSNIIECSYDELRQIVRQVQGLLRTGGKFCVEMQDGLERLQREAGPEALPELLSGEQPGTATVPGAGELAYPTTFWTVAFARHVVGEYLRFVRAEKVDEKRYWLEFERRA